MIESLIKNTGQTAAEEYGNLQSFFQVFQFFGALIAGVLLDRLGYKIGFIITFMASGISYYLMAHATSMSLLYASKIPTMFQHGFLCAQMAIAVITTSTSKDIKAEAEMRAAALGRLTTCYAVGMVVGPSLGGILGSNGDYHLGGKLAAAGSFLSVLLTLFLPAPSEAKGLSGNASADDDDKASDSDTTASDRVLDSKHGKQTDLLTKLSRIWSAVGVLLSAKVITSIANSMNATVFPLILKDTYSFDEQQLGFAMSFLSGLNSVINAVFIGPFVVFLGGQLTTVIKVALLGLFSASVLQGLASFADVQSAIGGHAALVSYIGTSLVLSCFQYLLSTTITAESTGRVAADAKGTLLGLEHSLFAGARIMAPQWGIALLNGFTSGMSMVSFAGAGIFGFVILLVNTYGHKQLHAASAHKSD
jgi:hypothetical protein